jgi:uncharacterized protein (TIRG00374 family)
MIILPITLGVFLVWWSLSRLTPDGKVDLFNNIKSANYFWVFISLFLGLLSHLSRAYRWKYLLAPLGYKPRFLNSVYTIFIAYLFNLFIPRSGEIMRATAISKYEAIPFDKAFGTIVAERIIDVIVLLFFILVAFFYQFDLIKELVLSKIPENLTYSLLIGFLVVVFIGLFFLLIKSSKLSFFKKARNFTKGLFEGVKSIITMKKRGTFIAHTLFIWVMYLLMFYAASFAFTETSNLSLGAVITGFVVGSLSMAATNGGVGTYQLGVQQVLILYGIATSPALAFGMLMWSAQTIMVILFGGISFLALPIYNRKFLN